MTLLNKFASNVDKMSNGRLKIEVLTSGAIVNPFEILDAVNKGVVDSGQWWTHYATGKHPAGGLFSAPLGGSGSGLDQMGQLGWYFRGGGRELYIEYYTKILKADVMPFLYAPDGPECFGWFKKPVTSVAEFTKLRFRISSGLPSDVLKDMGGVPMNLPGQELIPAAERGIVDGVEWINPANDLPLGLSDVFKFYSIQGLASGDRHRRCRNQRRKVACTAAGHPGNRGDSAHGFAVRGHAVLRARERQGAAGTDQAKGREDVRCAGRLRTRVHQVSEESSSSARGKGSILQEGARFTACLCGMWSCLTRAKRPSFQP